MKNLTRAAICFGGAVAVIGVFAVAAGGCGGDDTAVTQDSGTKDGTTDGTTDVGQRPDTGSDVADAGALDSSDASDRPDVQVDAPALVDFPRSVSSAWCSRLQQCCLISSGQFNMDYCVSSIENIGGIYQNGLSSTEPYLDGGNVQFDSDAAKRCLGEVAVLPCGVLQSTTLLRIRDDCFAAVKGTIPANGTGCRGSVECAPQSYCDVGPDGGTCLPVLGAGTPCTMNDQCTYRGSGAPAQYCDIGFRDGGTRTCVPQRDLDGGCGDVLLYNLECKTNICVRPGNCASQNVFSDPGVPNGTCDRLTIKDAGGD